MTTQRNISSSTNSTPNLPFSDQDLKQACALQKRWQTIRLQEIQRQLRVFTGCDYVICTDQPFHQSEQIIYIPEHSLNLPFEVLAAMAAHYWCQRSLYPSLSCLYPQTDFMSTYAFVASFLVRYQYPIKNILHHFLTHSEEELLQQLPGLAKQMFSLVMAYQQAKKFNLEIDEIPLGIDIAEKDNCPLLVDGPQKFKRRILKHPLLQVM